LQKTGFEYKEKDKHLSEEKYYDVTGRPAVCVWGVSLFVTITFLARSIGLPLIML
jgi:hypothetical protein